MSLTVKSSGGGEDFPKLQPGKYEGTCFRIVDLGTREKEFKGEKFKKKELRLEFEITKAVDPADNEITMEDERPFGVSKTYTASLFEAANLRKDLENWRDKTFTQEELDGFDVSKLIGMTARIEIGHTASDPARGFAGGNAKILKLSRPDGGVQKVATVNPQVIFDLDDYCDEFNGNMGEKSKAMVDVFDQLPVFIQNEIVKSFEYQAAVEEGEKTETSTPEPGLADLAKPDEDKDIEDQIPF
tara:strand:- start:1160 stop:1888 length:729 start_codon:yes stop_codon:yes gene_type:complete